MSQKSQRHYSGDLEVLPKKIQEEIERVCKRMKLSDTQKKKLIEAVKKEYFKSCFEPGEAIGIICAQSISEPATQMTMRTFHFAGSAGIQVTLGLPRLIEIFDARKEPSTPMMTLYLKKEYNTREVCEKLVKRIKEKRLRDFVDSTSLDITNKKIKIRLKDVKDEEREEVIRVLKERMKKYRVRVKGRVIEIASKEGKEELKIIDLQKIKRAILNLFISGIPRVLNAVVLKEGEDWVIRTFGSNFGRIFSFPEIDVKRCYTNNIHEIAEVLGIEAARSALIKEISETMQQQGLDVDERHIMLVADIMTFMGEVNPIGRYGVAGMKSTVLTRAGFEETIKHLVKASVRNEVDDFTGIFDNVMVNQQVPVGTGMFELIARMGEG